MEKAEDDQDSDREEHVHEIVSINLQAQKIPTSTTIFQLPDVDVYKRQLYYYYSSWYDNGVMAAFDTDFYGFTLAVYGFLGRGNRRGWLKGSAENNGAAVTDTCLLYTSRCV